MVRSPAIWALFDHLPAASYCKGRIAILGDAAHASTPHQGAGAGQAIEDALIMSEVLSDAHIRWSSDIPRAFQAYDMVRRPRSQRVVASSRAAGELYGFQGPAGDNIEKVRANLLSRYQWIWEEDLGRQLEKAKGYMTQLQLYSPSIRPALRPDTTLPSAKLPEQSSLETHPGFVRVTEKEIETRAS